MAERIRVELEFDARKGMVVLRDFDHKLTKAVSGAGGSGRAAAKAATGWNKLEGGLRSAAMQAAAVGGPLTSLTGALGGFGAAAGLAGAAAAGAAALVGRSLRTYAEFEVRLKQAGAVSGATKQEMATLGQAAQDTAREFGYLGRDGADALYFLGSSGMKASAQMAALPGVMALARAEGISLADSAALTSKTLSQFGYEADQATRVVNTLSAATAQSQAQIPLLAAALRQAGSTAREAGQDLELTVAQLMALFDVGKTGEMAGTAIRNILLSFATPATEAKKVLHDLGVETHDALGELRPLLDILKDLRQANIGLAEAEALVGRENADSLLALIRKIEAIERYNQSIRDTNTATRRAKEMQDSLKGSVDALAASWDALAITLGERFAPAAEKSYGLLSKLLDAAREWLSTSGSWTSPSEGSPFASSMSGFVPSDPLVPLWGKLWKRYSASADSLPQGFSGTDAASRALPDIYADQAADDTAKFQRMIRSLGGAGFTGPADAEKKALDYANRVQIAINEAATRAARVRAAEVEKLEREHFQRRIQMAQGYSFAVEGIDDEATRAGERELARRVDAELKADAQRLAAEQDLRNKIELAGTTGLERQKILLAQEVEALRAAKVDEGLITQYAAGRMVEINRRAGGQVKGLWASAAASMRQQWAYTWTDPFSESLNSAQDFFDRWVDSLDQMWRRGLSSMMNAFNSWLFGLAEAAGKDIWAGIFGGKGGNLSGILGNLFSSGSKGGSGALGMAAQGSTIALGAQKLGAWLGIGPATLPSIMGPVAGSMGGGMGGAMAQGLADLFATSASTSAASNAGSLAGMAALASPLGAFGLALGPGMLGMGLSQMGFLMDGPMSPEEAQQRIQANLDFVASLSKLGGALQDAVPHAQDLVDQIDKIAGRAGYSAEQIDDMVASLGPQAEALVNSARAANQVEDGVRRATEALIASQHDGFAPGADRAHEFAVSLAEVAAGAGLSKDALDRVNDTLDMLEGEATRGEISIQDMADAFRESLTEAAGAASASLDGVLERLGRVNKLGGGVSQMTLAGAVNEYGLSTAGGGKSLDDLGIGSFDLGGIVPGPVGQPRLAIVHGGEEIRTPQQQAEARAAAPQVMVNLGGISVVIPAGGGGLDGWELSGHVVDVIANQRPDLAQKLNLALERAGLPVAR